MQPVFTRHVSALAPLLGALLLAGVAHGQSAPKGDTKARLAAAAALADKATAAVQALHQGATKARDCAGLAKALGGWYARHGAVREVKREGETIRLDIFRALREDAFALTLRAADRKATPFAAAEGRFRKAVAAFYAAPILDRCDGEAAFVEKVDREVFRALGWMGEDLSHWTVQPEDEKALDAMRTLTKAAEALVPVAQTAGGCAAYHDALEKWLDRYAAPTLAASQIADRPGGFAWQDDGELPVGVHAEARALSARYDAALAKARPKMLARTCKGARATALGDRLHHGAGMVRSLEVFE